MPGKAGPKASAGSRRPRSAAPARRPAAPRKAAARPKAAGAGQDGARLVDRRIREAGGWRGAALARMRALILEADPAIEEDVKWRKPSNGMQGVAVWSRGGLVCTGEAYKDKVKLTFARGAALPDPAGLFNAGQGGGTRRAIDLRQGEAEAVDAAAFKALVRAAVAENAAARRTGP